MDQIHIDKQVKERKGKLKEIGSRLTTIATKFGANQHTREILENQIRNIGEQFLFVIVGEVNAGKSSFVNGLLGAEICASGHEITTQNVEKIVHGETALIQTDENRHLVTRQHPADILREITIVDTPGTNSKVLDHQLITEKFIPQSNLVVFIFQVSNIHVQSAWDLFQKINEQWRKKVIFVLTQKDRFDQEEVDAYVKTLQKYAVEAGVSEPIIFPTSSKKEAAGATEESGFGSVRTYINDEVLRNAAMQKVEDDVQTLLTIQQNIQEEFAIRKAKFDEDNGTRRKIHGIVEDKEALAKSNVQSLINKSLRAYDSNAEKTIETIRKGIGFFQLSWKSIRSAFGGETPKSWLTRVNQEHVDNLNDDINQVLGEGTDVIKSDIQYMVIGVKNELDNLRELPLQPNVMFNGLDEERTEIIYSLKSNLTDFIEKSPVFQGGEILRKEGVNYQDVNVATGIAAVGTAMAIISQASVIDITGGIATGLGLLVASGIAITKKGRYLREVRKTLDTNREKLETELANDLTSYVGRIRQQIDKQFAELDHHLQSEENRIREYDEMAGSIHSDLKNLQSVSS
ncbi:MAG: dynamin family protein [Bacteroidota bacterium]